MDAAICETVSADVVVIGAGYTGLSAALHLAQAGVSVAVLAVSYTHLTLPTIYSV